MYTSVLTLQFAKKKHYSVIYVMHWYDTDQVRTVVIAVHLPSRAISPRSTGAQCWHVINNSLGD